MRYNNMNYKIKFQNPLIAVISGGGLLTALSLNTFQRNIFTYEKVQVVL